MSDTENHAEIDFTKDPPQWVGPKDGIAKVDKALVDAPSSLLVIKHGHLIGLPWALTCHGVDPSNGIAYLVSRAI